jgi:hypothetical protein
LGSLLHALPAVAAVLLPLLCVSPAFCVLPLLQAARAMAAIKKKYFFMLYGLCV